MRCVEGRPSNLAPEDLLNLHMTDESIFQLASSEKMTALAARLLGTEDVWKVAFGITRGHCWGARPPHGRVQHTSPMSSGRYNLLYIIPADLCHSDDAK